MKLFLCNVTGKVNASNFSGLRKIITELMNVTVFRSVLQWFFKDK